MQIRPNIAALVALVGMLVVPGNRTDAASADAERDALRPVAVPAGQTTLITAVHLLVDDAEANRQFYTQALGMKIVSRDVAHGEYERSILSFDRGPPLLLWSSGTKGKFARSPFPVLVVYTSDFADTLARLEHGNYRVRRMPRDQTRGDDIAVTRDVAGNALEIIGRPGKPSEIGGPRLIVDEREKAESFYRDVLEAKVDERFVSPLYDQVYMTLGSGPFLSVFQPKSAGTPAKPEIPAMSVETTQLEQVLLRIRNAGLSYREMKTERAPRSVLAFDTAGNGIELVQYP